MPTFYQDRAGYKISYQYPDPAVLRITQEGQGEKPPYSAQATWYVMFDEDTEAEHPLIEQHDIESQAQKLLLDSGRVPFRYLGLRLNRINAEWIAARTARIDLEYGLPCYQAGEDGWDREFNVTTRSIHVNHSRYGVQTGQSFMGNTEVHPDEVFFGNLIGVNQDGIAGVDIDEAIGNYVMSTSFAPDHPFSIHLLNIRQRVAKYVNRINSTPFEGFAARELRLGSGTSVTRSHDGTTNLTLNFQYAPTEQVDIPIYQHVLVDENGNPGGGTRRLVPTVKKFIPKGGWDYLWFFTRKIMQRVGSIQMTVQQPLGAQINHVYRAADFNQLVADLS